MQKPMPIVILTSASLKQSLEALVAWLMLLCLAVMKAQTIHGQWHHHQSYHHHRHQSLSSKRAESKTHKWLCQCHLSISIGSLWAVQVELNSFLFLCQGLFWFELNCLQSLQIFPIKPHYRAKPEEFAEIGGIYKKTEGDKRMYGGIFLFTSTSIIFKSIDIFYYIKKNYNKKNFGLFIIVRYLMNGLVHFPLVITIMVELEWAENANYSLTIDKIKFCKRLLFACEGREKHFVGQ